jgi:choline dehydrogenase-like flavoprotein
MAHPQDPAIRLLNVMVANMNVQSAGTVSLKSTDPRDEPVIDPNLLGHAFDRRVMIEGVKEAMRLLTDSPLKSQIQMVFRAPKTTSDEDIQIFLDQWTDTTWHANGTTKMGLPDRDPSTCVDSDFRVIGINGLRVADLSVCPFVPK